MPQIVFTATPEGHVDYYNRQWYEYTGLTEGEIGGEDWTRVLDADGLRRVEERWREALARGGVYDVEFRIRRRDGSYRWFKTRAVPLRDSDGQKVLPIWVGVFEANAIALQIENIQTPRPMTHDLLRNIIQDLQATVDKIVVCDLKENTFYAMIHLKTPLGPVAIDARPSDAIACLERADAVILRRDACP
mgnify:CR=1 FL=1